MTLFRDGSKLGDMEGGRYSVLASHASEAYYEIRVRVWRRDGEGGRLHATYDSGIGG